MNTDFSLMEWLANVIDYWWAWLIPALIIFILKNYIRNGFYYFKLKWSDSPYTNVGNLVQFSEKGTLWKVYKITLNNVFLEVDVNHDGSLDLMRMPIDKFYNSTIIYRKV